MQTFDEILTQVLALLQRDGRVAYRVLKRRFALDDEYIEDLKADLIDAKRLAIDEDGKVLVWTGSTHPFQTPDSELQTPNFSRLRTPDARLQTRDARPISYTPPYLAQRILAEQAAMEARGASDGERKTITALFADIKDSTSLIEDLDPEDARHLIDPALHLMMDAVHRYEGYVTQSLGDGIFALFGAPIACEDHPQRALYAALRMQEEMKRFAEQLRREKGRNVEIRVGVNTGDVVLRSIRRDDLHTDYTPVGHSTSLASRMEIQACVDAGGGVQLAAGGAAQGAA